MSDKFQPAFPSPMFASQAAQGMTLRDYFAAAALQALISSPDYLDTITARGFRRGTEASGLTAQAAYVYADAMLAEREKVAK